MRTIILIFTIIFTVAAKGQSVDLKLLMKINTPFSEPADQNWNTISDLNAPVCIITPAAIFVTGLIKNDKALLNKSYQIASSVVISEMIALAMKEIVKRDRPFTTHPDDIYKKASVTGYSFPSGHTSTSFALATSLTLNFPKWYVIVPAYAYAGTIAYSRMYLGVHYPTDVLGGMVIGAGSAYLSYKINGWLTKKK